MSSAATDTEGFAETAFLLRAFQVSKMLEVAASLGLADRISDEKRPFDQLADECRAQPAMLLRLCRALAAFGVFSVDIEGNVGHTEKSRWLRSNATPTLHYAARYWGMPSTWAAWGNLEYAIRTGKASFEDTFGMPNFDYLSAHPQEASVFDAFMQHSPDDRHAAVAEAYDFSGASVVVDVGGGNGALLRAILAAHPHVRGILFDQESVVSGAVLGDYARRCAIDPGSFFERVSLGGDIYTLSQILHDWSDERCLQILGNCRAAMNDGGRLLVIERILDTAPGRTNAINFLADMHMMVLFPGARERTPEEFTQLFTQAGFTPPRIIPTRSAYCMLETRKAG